MSISCKDFIRRVRAATNSTQERAVVETELAAIRTSLKQRDQPHINENIAKLIYAGMNGNYNVSWSHMAIINQCSSSRSHQGKRIAYLAVSLLMSEHEDLLKMVTNSIKSDLECGSQCRTAVAISALGSVGTSEMITELSGPLMNLIMNANSIYVRKKALLAICRGVELSPESSGVYVKPCEMALTDKSHAIVLTSYELARVLVQRNVEGAAVAFIPKLHSVCRVLAHLNGVKFTPDHEIGGVCDPMVQVAAIRFLQTLVMAYCRLYAQARAEQQAQGVEGPVAVKIPGPEGDLVDITIPQDTVEYYANTLEAVVSRGPKGSESVSARVSIQFEAARCILSTPTFFCASSDLRAAAIDALTESINHKSQSVRYSSLATLADMIRLTGDTSGAHRHRSSVLSCMQEQSIALRKRALSLLVLLVDEESAEQTVYDMLELIAPRQEANDDDTAVEAVEVKKQKPRKIAFVNADIKSEIMTSIAFIAERFAPSPKWYFDILLRLLNLCENTSTSATGNNSLGSAVASQSTVAANAADALLVASVGNELISSTAAVVQRNEEKETCDLQSYASEVMGRILITAAASIVTANCTQLAEAIAGIIAGTASSSTASSSKPEDLVAAKNEDILRFYAANRQLYAETEFSIIPASVSLLSNTPLLSAALFIAGEYTAAAGGTEGCVKILTAIDVILRTSMVRNQAENVKRYAVSAVGKIGARSSQDIKKLAMQVFTQLYTATDVETQQRVFEYSAAMQSKKATGILGNIPAPPKKELKLNYSVLESRKVREQKARAERERLEKERREKERLEREAAEAERRKQMEMEYEARRAKMPVTTSAVVTSVAAPGVTPVIPGVAQAPVQNLFAVFAGESKAVAPALPVAAAPITNKPAVSTNALLDMLMTPQQSVAAPTRAAMQTAAVPAPVTSFSAPLTVQQPAPVAAAANPFALFAQPSPPKPQPVAAVAPAPVSRPAAAGADLLDLLSAPASSPAQAQVSPMAQVGRMLADENYGAPKDVFNEEGIQIKMRSRRLHAAGEAAEVAFGVTAQTQSKIKLDFAVPTYLKLNIIQHATGNICSPGNVIYQTINLANTGAQTTYPLKIKVTYAVGTGPVQTKILTLANVF